MPGIKWIFLLLVMATVGCRQSDEREGPPVAPEATRLPPASDPTATPADNSLYLPLASNSRIEATPTPEPTATSTPLPPAFPIYEGSPLLRSNIGVQIHLHREDLDQVFHHLETLGAGWVKVQISWKLYQPYPDRYSDERFTQLDRLVESADARGIAVLLSVTKAPEWSRPTNELDGPPLDTSLYEAFLFELATRYRGRVAAYELWNEPNLQREWNGFPLSAADFVTLMQKGAAGVRAADADAILISGAPATTGINDGVAAIDDRRYLTDMIRLGAAEIVDAIGAHPYGWANPPDSSVSSPDPAVTSHNDHPSFFFQDTLLDYKGILDEAKVTKQIWVTEFGWGSFDRFPAPPPAGAEFMSAVSEWQQASYILRAYDMATAWDWMGPMTLWNLNFGPLLGEQFSEAGYSLLRPDGSPRPAYAALAAVPKR